MEFTKVFMHKIKIDGFTQQELLQELLFFEDKRRREVLTPKEGKFLTILDHGICDDLTISDYTTEKYEAFLVSKADIKEGNIFVVMNRIPVKEEFASQFEERFATRAGLVDGMPGFLGNEVLRPLENDLPYVVLTYWQDEKSFKNWVNSDEFKQGHSRSGQLPHEAFKGRNAIETYSSLGL